LLYFQTGVCYNTYTLETATDLFNHRDAGTAESRCMLQLRIIRMSQNFHFTWHSIRCILWGLR
jgi:hypothetical protein